MQDSLIPSIFNPTGVKFVGSRLSNQKPPMNSIFLYNHFMNTKSYCDALQYWFGDACKISWFLPKTDSLQPERTTRSYQRNMSILGCTSTCRACTCFLVSLSLVVASPFLQYYRGCILHSLNYIGKWLQKPKAEKN